MLCRVTTRRASPCELVVALGTRAQIKWVEVSKIDCRAGTARFLAASEIVHELRDALSTSRRTKPKALARALNPATGLLRIEFIGTVGGAVVCEFRERFKLSDPKCAVDEECTGTAENVGWSHTLTYAPPRNGNSVLRHGNRNSKPINRKPVEPPRGLAVSVEETNDQRPRRFIVRVFGKRNEAMR